MPRNAACLLLCLLSLGASLRAQDAELPRIPELTPESREAWKRHILPTPEERAFEEIAWLDGFAAGINAARREGKPLLFYAMNGHPLGCT